MTEPFDEKDVLYRFVPSEEERKFAQEYVYVRGEEENALYFQGRDGHWRTSLRLDRLIAGLLADRAALAQERDVYRKVLEMYASEENWLTAGRWADVFASGYDTARAVLAEGEKIREGK